jgi:hypothetical protein
MSAVGTQPAQALTALFPQLAIADMPAPLPRPVLARQRATGVPCRQCRHGCAGVPQIPFLR